MDSLVGKKGKLPPGFMDRTADFFRLDPCDYSRSGYTEDRAYAGLSIGNEAVSCNVWPTPNRNQIAFSSSLRLGQRSISVVGYVSRRFLGNEPPKALAIYMIGGPAGDISPGLNDQLPSELVRRGYAVIKLGYSGTRHGSVYPNPDFDIAAAQLKSYILSLEKIGKSHAKIILIGESLGAQIVERAITVEIASHISGVVLAEPLMLSPKGAMLNFTKVFGLPATDDSKSIIRILNKCSPIKGEYVSVKTSRLFMSFFPKDIIERDLRSYISENKDLTRVLAYGDADRRIGIESIPTIEACCPAVNTLRLSGVGHVIEAGEAGLIADRMDKVFDWKLASPASPAARTVAR